MSISEVASRRSWKKPVNLEATAGCPAVGPTPAQALADFVKRKRPKPKGLRPVSKATRAQYFEEAQQMSASQDWDEAGPRHLVSLYEWMHARVYGAACAMTNREFSIAMTMAGKLVKDFVGGDIIDAVEFMRWVWRREGVREKQRRLEPEKVERGGSRLSWRFQFSAALVTDWRVDKARRGSRGDVH